MNLTTKDRRLTIQSFPQGDFYSLFGRWWWGENNTLSFTTFLQIPTNLPWMYHAWKQTRGMKKYDVRLIEYKNYFIPVVKYDWNCYRSFGFWSEDARQERGPVYENKELAEAVASLRMKLEN